MKLASILLPMMPSRVRVDIRGAGTFTRSLNCAFHLTSYIDTPYLIRPCLAHPPQQHCESHLATEYRTSAARSRPVSLAASSRCQAACSHLRRSTLCTNNKIKVKCDIKTTGAPCTRCRTRGLSCTVNKSLQMLLEDDASYAILSPVLIPF
jgi:hypothetical protein